MIDDQENPFLPTRWEHHGSNLPLIWFSETAKKITGDKPTYIAGTRGSGKTTLLKSICWEDLVNNPSLQAQRTLTDLDYIGIYVKFPEHISTSIGTQDWSEIFPNISESEAEANSFFSLVVECICIDKALSAVSELRQSKKLHVSAEDEVEFCHTICEEYPNLEQFSDLRPASFDQLARLMRNLVRRMNEASRRGTISRLAAHLPSREPLELLRDVTSFLNRRCELIGKNKRFKPAFKFCLDDSEVLNSQQRMTINSMVRNSRHPITWVICSVGDAVASVDTYLDNQKMAEADRRILLLNDRDPKEFASLCEVVANMRLLMAKYPAASAFSKLQSDNFKELSLKNKFGETLVNEMIHGIVTRSVKKEKHILIKGAKLLESKMNTYSKPKKGSKTKALPYAQTYLLMLWQGREESFAIELDESQLEGIEEKANKLKIPSFNAWLRRKYVAALLNIADMLDTKNIGYTGFDALISMSDGSIRDFLEIMAEVFKEHANDLRKSNKSITTEEIISRFQKSNQKLSPSVQSAAFQSASKSFLDGAGLVTTSEAGAMVNLINFLGSYTSYLQSNSKTTSSIRFCERGIFTINIGRRMDLFSSAEQLEELLELLWQAELSGYIRRIDVSRNSIPENNLVKADSIGPTTFRLHKRLAPHFLFSYRGAYEGVRIDPNHLWQTIGDGNRQIKFGEWIDGHGPSDELSGIQIPMDFEQ